MTGSTGAEDPPTRVEVPGGQGVQVGDHATQHNKYIQTNIETIVIQPSPMPVASPRLPGSGRPVWNIPARNPGFTGRDDLLAELRERLLAGDKAVVQALHGMGGVGKTQLATEYAHRFAASYDLAWWVNSEQAGLIGDQFAALGVALGCVQAGAGTQVVQAVVLAELRERSRWLLVFDNAENPADISGWLPGGGHVLITSRQRGWADVATSVEVDVLARPESVAILQARVPRLTRADADRLAAELGDLPLAITQAAGFMAETGMAAAQYLGLLLTRAGQLLAEAPPGSAYPHSLAAATRLIADRLAEDDPAAAELARVCAFLAPEPIPEDLFADAASVLPDELAARVGDPLAWPRTLAHLARQSLVRIDHRGLQMHRLTQAIFRDLLTPDEAADTHARTEAMLAASNPGDPDNPATWPRWAQLMPHLLHADLATADDPSVRQLACDGCWYLLAHGDTAPPLISPVSCASSGATGSATTTSTRWRPRGTSAGRSRRWAATAKRATWTGSHWTASAGCWARTTPAPWSWPTTLSMTCVCSASCRPPATWPRTAWTVSAGSWARTTPTPCAWHSTWPPPCASWARCRPPAT